MGLHIRVTSPGTWRHSSSFMALDMLIPWPPDHVEEIIDFEESVNSGSHVGM